MPTHDIIDNRNEKLVGHIKGILSSRVAFRGGRVYVIGRSKIENRNSGLMRDDILG